MWRSGWRGLAARLWRRLENRNARKKITAESAENAEERRAVGRFYYEDAEEPWRPDGILRMFLPERRPAYAKASAFAKATADESAGRSRAKALDLGMGYGRNAVWLAERGYEVEGWERDKRYVAEARREVRKRLQGATSDWRLATGEKKKNREGKLVVKHGDFVRARWQGPYDVIVISQALHQMKRSQALRVLGRAKKALAPARLRRPAYAKPSLGSASFGSAQDKRDKSGGSGYGGRGGRLFLLVKLTSDRHVQRVRRDPAWRPVKGERNTFLRPSARKRGSYHAGRPRTPQMYLSALEPREIRQALKGLRVVHWRRVVLRSDWEEERPVTHTVAEVVAERR